MRHTVTMPELPEVETIRTTLDSLLRGRTIAGVDVYWERTIGHPDIESFRCKSIGQTIASVDRRAKLLVMRLEAGDVLTIHLRMTGELRFHVSATDSSPTPYLRSRFTFVDGSLLDFNDVRKFGRIELLSSEDFRFVSESLGEEPLSTSFSPDVLREILRSRSRQIKPLLLDQRVIAGLGNIYADEALFRAGIHPLTSSSTIPEEHVARLHAAIVDVLSEAVEHRGTTLRDYRSGLGDRGENQSRLLVYGRGDGSPCLTCGTPLTRTVVGQRGTMFCATCQPLLIPR